MTRPFHARVPPADVLLLPVFALSPLHSCGLADYLEAYYGNQLPALECVKLKYDPSNLFSMPMDVRPTVGSSAHCPELLSKVGKAAANYSRYLLTSGPARSGNTDKSTKVSANTVTEVGKKTSQAAPAAAKTAGRKLAHIFAQWYSSS